MKYADTKVVFREVPDEITLAVNISGCPVGCKGCHSPYLAEDVGEELDPASLDRLIAENPGISCISLMGGDADPAYVGQLCRHVKESHPGLRTCWYSGRLLDRAGDVLPWLDYIKVGPWIEEFGPLDSPTTNQRFYAVFHDPTPATPASHPGACPASSASSIAIPDSTPAPASPAAPSSPASPSPSAPAPASPASGSAPSGPATRPQGSPVTSSLPAGIRLEDRTSRLRKIVF